MEQLQLYLHVAQETDCEKPGETFTQQVRETYRDCFINEHVILGKYYTFNYLLELK